MLKQHLFNSSFYGSEVDETKLTYKNGLMAFVLEKMGSINKLKRLQK